MLRLSRDTYCSVTCWACGTGTDPWVAWTVDVAVLNVAWDVPEFETIGFDWIICWEFVWNSCEMVKIYYFRVKEKSFFTWKNFKLHHFKNLRKYLKENRVTINICANNYLGLFYLLVASWYENKALVGWLLNLGWGWRDDLHLTIWQTD